MTIDNSMFTSYTLMSSSNENIISSDNVRGDVIGLGKIAITLEHSITNVFLNYMTWVTIDCLQMLM
jgi:hypothetical protein